MESRNVFTFGTHITMKFVTGHNIFEPKGQRSRSHSSQMAP